MEEEVEDPLTDRELNRLLLLLLKSRIEKGNNEEDDKKCETYYSSGN